MGRDITVLRIGMFYNSCFNWLNDHTFCCLNKDAFLEKAALRRTEMGLPPPVTFGLAFDEQIISNVPVDSHDR